MSDAIMVALVGLSGLKEQGCNGRVTEALDALDKHLNKEAHKREGEV